MALGGAIWGACARSYGSMAGARVLLAFGLSAVHALGGITVADIFPREVRGEKMGWWTLLVVIILWAHSSHSSLTFSDHAGTIPGTNFRRLHRPGYRQLVLDIWTSCSRIGGNSDLYVSKMLGQICEIPISYVCTESFSFLRHCILKATSENNTKHESSRSGSSLSSTQKSQNGPQHSSDQYALCPPNLVPNPD